MEPLREKKKREGRQGSRGRHVMTEVDELKKRGKSICLVAERKVVSEEQTLRLKENDE